MRLVSASVAGYKRFHGVTVINLADNPIYTVGPNGAGKTSLLDALVSLNSEDEFDESARSRLDEVPTTTVEATFELDSSDVASIAHIDPAMGTERLVVVKSSVYDSLRYRLEPEVYRDLAQRKAACAAVEDSAEEVIERAVAVEAEYGETYETSLHDLVAKGLEALRAEQEWLDPQEIVELEEIRSRFRNYRQRYLENLGEQDADDEHVELLDRVGRELELAIEEDDNHPRTIAVTALAHRVPEFLKFEEVSRNLESAYDLAGDRPTDGAAIHNLLRLAGKTWEEAAAAASGDPGRRKRFVEGLDLMLREKVGRGWGNTPLEVGAELDGSQLNLVLRMQNDDFMPFEQQSDGLRQFVALRAFVVAHELEVQPIILIDEVERHLHYDAQASLITVFEEQTEAAQIIYTTHSAGSLPRDIAIGTGGGSDS